MSLKSFATDDSFPHTWHLSPAIQTSPSNSLKMMGLELLRVLEVALPGPGRVLRREVLQVGVLQGAALQRAAGQIRSRERGAAQREQQG